MHASQAAQGERFRELHQRGRAFVVANAWDAGTAKLLALVGFDALATTSAGFAFSLARSDGTGSVSRDEMLDNARTIAEATDLPVSADLENGWGDDPEACAETIRLAARAGLVGGSIEDATSRPDEPVYPFELAVDRVRAAAEAARSLPFPFTLTARAENFLQGRPDLGDTIARLQAFAAAGADVLYAPGLRNLADVASVVRSVDRPVNVLMGGGGLVATVEELSAVGVARISVGSAFCRAALGELRRAATEVFTHGTFGFGAEAVPYAELNRQFQ